MKQKAKLKRKKSNKNREGDIRTRFLRETSRFQKVNYRIQEEKQKIA